MQGDVPVALGKGAKALKGLGVVRFLDGMSQAVWDAAFVTGFPYRIAKSSPYYKERERLCSWAGTQRKFKRAVNLFGKHGSTWRSFLDFLVAKKLGVRSEGVFFFRHTDIGHRFLETVKVGPAALAAYAARAGKA